MFEHFLDNFYRRYFPFAYLGRVKRRYLAMAIKEERSHVEQN